MNPSLKNLPGAELIEQGLQDLEKSLLTIPALLICIGKSRLENAGLSFPNLEQFPNEPELMLYALILQGSELDPYSYYNSLLRRLISFEKALEQRHYSSSRRAILCRGGTF